MQMQPGLDEGFLGWISGSAAICSIVSAIACGLLLHLFKHKTLLLATLVLALVSSIMYALVEDIPGGRGYVILTSRLVMGFGAGKTHH